MGYLYGFDRVHFPRRRFFGRYRHDEDIRRRREDSARNKAQGERADRAHLLGRRGILPDVGKAGQRRKEAEELQRIGITTVRDIYSKRETVIRALGNHGQQVVDLADGIDGREVAAQTKSQSFGKEHTFQQDTTDFDYLKDVLRLTARELSFPLRLEGTYCRTVTLKVTYKGFKKITRSKSGEPINKADDIYNTAALLLDKIERHPVRLVGITLSGFTDALSKQLSLLDLETDKQVEKRDAVMTELQRRYGMDAVKTGGELIAEKRLQKEGEPHVQ